jgi:hypothetical protein
MLLAAEWLVWLDLALFGVLRWCWQPTPQLELLERVPALGSPAGFARSMSGILGPTFVALGVIPALLTLAVGWQPIRTYGDELLWRAVPYLFGVQLFALLLWRVVPAERETTADRRMFPITPAALRAGALRLLNGARNMTDESVTFQHRLLERALDLLALFAAAVIAITLARAALALTLDTAPIFVSAAWLAYTLLAFASLRAPEPAPGSSLQAADDDSTDELIPDPALSAG